MNTTIDPLYNPYDPAFILDPYSTYEVLRKKQPVYLTAYGFWIVSRYDHVKNLMSNKSLGKRFTNEFVRMFGPEVSTEPLVKLANHMMLLQDPPDHKITREIAIRAFNKKTIAGYTGMIQATADELIAKLRDKSEFDIVAEVAHPLPLLVICRMLGIDGEDRDVFMQKLPVLNTLGRMFEPASLTRQDLNNLNDNAKLLTTYFSKFYDRYRDRQDNELISSFVQLEEENKISHDAVIANIILLFLAGYETTAKFIGNALLSLYRHPHQLTVLRKDPSLFPRAVKELMRYESPMQISGRITLEDVEIDGTKIPKGETIITLIGSANHDEQVFDNPGELNFLRPEIRNMSFGGGIHLCPGEQLSYLETEIVLRTLLQSFPDLQLMDIESPSWEEKTALRGLTQLIAKRG